jgi:polyhydroxyalkanoate synthesis regulator phasin
MPPLKPPPDSPYKAQLRKIKQLVSVLDEKIDQNTDRYIDDVVHLVHTHITVTNRTMTDLRKQVARLEAELERFKNGT